MYGRSNNRSCDFRNEFQEIIEKQNGYSFPCTPVPNDSLNKSASRATTPSGYGKKYQNIICLTGLHCFDL